MFTTEIVGKLSHHRQQTPSQTAASEKRGGYLAGKRVFDVTIGLVWLIIAAPIIALAALLVKLTSSGPAFYTQIRMGQGGHPFLMYKLRTMIQESEAKTGATWATPDDPRITYVGKFLRLSHLDELPQLWNVLKGDMSLIGPRPERPEFLPELVKAHPNYRDRLLVRPGLTGLAQVRFSADTDLQSVGRKLAYDRYYVQRVSFGLDLRILVCTAIFLLLEVPLRVTRELLLVLDKQQISDDALLVEADGNESEKIVAKLNVTEDEAGGNDQSRAVV